MQPRQHVLRVGTFSGWPPYAFLDERGAYQGLDMDLAREIARRLGKDLEVYDMETGALIAALMQNKVDLIINGLSITQERTQKIAMIPYQGEPITSYPLVFYKQVPCGIKELQDFARYPDKVVLVEPGSSQDAFLSKFPDIQVRRVDALTGLLELQYGKADAMLICPNILADARSKNPALIAINVPLDQASQDLGNGIGISYNNEQLITQVQTIVVELQKEGFIDQTR